MKNLFLPETAPVPLDVWVWVQDTPWDIVCYKICEEGVRSIDLPSGRFDMLPARVGYDVYSFVPLVAVGYIEELLSLQEISSWCAMKDRRMLLNKLEEKLNDC